MERNQNPIVGSTIDLRLVTFNSNSLANVSSIVKVEIYKLDPLYCSDSNKDGRTLVATVTDISEDSVGNYSISLETSAPLYTIGKYLDVWHVVFREDDAPNEIENRFEIYSDLWFTTTTPAIYGFSFEFQPNRIRKGSIKWLIIKITPNVPRATELERYYTNLAIAGDLKLTFEQSCGSCKPNDIILEDEPVTIRDKIFGYYKLDTTEDGLDLETGIYNIWFTLNFADTIDISPVMQLQIY